MAMKPVGKAIVIGLVAVAIVVGGIYSGALDKLKKAEEQQSSAPVPVQPAPAPEPPAAVAAPAPAAQPAPATQADSALDALIRQSGKK